MKNETQEVTLMKGNEAIARAAIRCGVDGFFGYPITPQSEIIETLALDKPWETTGMVVLQAESEVAAINMVHGAAGAGKKAFTSSSSPGVALMQECISYMAGSEIPGVVVNVQRGGPGLGTIQPSQRVTICRQQRVVVMATIMSLFLHRHLFRRWPTLLIWLSNWHSNTEIRL